MASNTIQPTNHHSAHAVSRCVYVLCTSLLCAAQLAREILASGNYTQLSIRFYQPYLMHCYDRVHKCCARANDMCARTDTSRHCFTKNALKFARGLERNSGQSHNVCCVSTKELSIKRNEFCLYAHKRPHENERMRSRLQITRAINECGVCCVHTYTLYFLIKLSRDIPSVCVCYTVARRSCAKENQITHWRTQSPKP